MVQQYLPPALMLEQLRNERYRQAAQGMQQGLGQALQTFMTMEQLKQAAAEKQAEREQRAEEFDARQRLQRAQLRSLDQLRQGQLGVQQQQQALAEKKAGEARADVLRGQTQEDVQRMALGIAKGQKPITGVDAPTAKEFMQQGISRFGQKAQTADEATGRLSALLQNLEQLAAEQEERPEALALAEAARVKGIDLPYGELRGVMTQTLADREKAALGLDKLRAEASASRALAAQRRAGGGGHGRSVAGKPLVSADVLQKALGSELSTIDVEDRQLEPLAAAISDLRSYKKDITGAEIPPSPQDLAKANSLEQELTTKKAALQERRSKAVVDFREALRRLGEGRIDVYDTMAARQAQAAQQTDVGVPESLRRPEAGQTATEQYAAQQRAIPSGIMGSKDEILKLAREAMQDRERVTPDQLNNWLNMQDAKGVWGQNELQSAQERMKELRGEGLNKEQIAAIVGREFIKQPGLMQQIKTNPYGRTLLDLLPKPPRPNYGTGMTMAE